jgi:carboxypeptidase Taq
MMKMVEVLSSYKKLMEKNKEIVILQSAMSIIGWDMETKMPPKGIALRSQQFALLSRTAHKMNTNPEIGTLLNEITKHPDYDKLDTIQKRNVYLAKKTYDEQTKLPEDLVAEMAKQEAIATDVWKKAKAAKDFSMFKPELQKVVDLRKKAAEILMTVKETPTPYDALIDIFEPKMTAEQISPIFAELQTGLTTLIKKCVNAPKQPDETILKRPVPIDIQRKISNSLAKFIEYDVESKQAGGRIDETEHPFTTGYYDDVRITTHYYETNFTSSIFSILHEGGHAIYEQDLPQEWMYQPVGNGCSSGFHESQSRFVENIFGRSHEFWTYYLPKLKELTGNSLSDVDLDMFVRAVNRVKPSKIRIESDEVTYSLHIIIRFILERDLFADKITVAELPTIWNQKYKEYLGIDIENDSEGVMQDTHWSGGGFGYFPSYALGNIFGGQILTAMEKDLPDWKNHLAKGEFHTIKQWLAQNVHSHGNLQDPVDLIKKITGQPIQVKPFIDYLNEKFNKLYEF